MARTAVGLIVLNLALAVYLASAVYQSRSPRVAAIGSNTGGKSFADRASTTAERNAPRPAANTAPAKPTWASVASSDLHRYAANLRSIGCPEQTIKDILLAEANRVFGLQERALKVRPDDVAPWEAAARFDRRSNESKLRQLLEDKRKLLKELTGVDVGIDMPTRLAGRDVEKFEGAFTAIPEAKRDQVRAIQESYWAQSDDIKQRTLGYLEPEDRDEFQRIKTERHDALAQVLSPRELQDFEMQTSETANSLKTRMKGADLSDDEMRKIFDYMQPLDEKYSLSRRNPDPVNAEFTAARTQAEKDLEQQIKSVMGDDRYAEYQRNKDPVYKSISQIGTDAGLSKDSIVQAYQAQRDVQDQSARIMQDPNLTPEQRAQGLNDLRTQVGQKLQQLFGDKAAQLMSQFPGGPGINQRYNIPPNLVPALPPAPVDNVRITP